MAIFIAHILSSFTIMYIGKFSLNILAVLYNTIKRFNKLSQAPLGYKTLHEISTGPRRLEIEIF